MARASSRWVRTRRLLAAAGAGLVVVPGAVAPAQALDLGLGSLTDTITTVLPWGDARADTVSQGTGGSYDAAKDPGSLYTVTRALGARDAWGQRDAAGRAITGQGVTVAVLDSGLAPVAGLDLPGKVLQGPDLTPEVNAEQLRGLDTFGHGTHLGAIIAGQDARTVDRSTDVPRGSRAADQLGLAPGARLMPLKLATANGSTDVSQVIAALDWVSQHGRDPGVNARVVNLAFGSDSLQSYQLDPLAAAAENAWRRGIVVVVSGGNAGQQAGRLTNPAIDPYVLAVGASDGDLRLDGWRNPKVAAFSNSGTTARHADVLAPGRSITSLRTPGSYIDAQHPEGRVAGDSTGRLFRGSGTSQAAAVVSGAAALMLQANPSLTPDQVKAILTRTAVPVPGVSPVYQGAGQIDVKAAVALARNLPAELSATSPKVVQTHPRATGLGTLDAARGATPLLGDLSLLLSGELDVQGLPFVPATWMAESAAGRAWSGGVWNGAAWTGTGWESARWSSDAWDSARWSSARWSSARWSSARWSDAQWESARWSGASWSSARWSSDDWA